MLLRKQAQPRQAMIQGEMPMWAEYFIYNVDMAIPAGGTVTPGMNYSDFEIRVDSDADFEIINTTYVASVNGDVKIKFKDDAESRYFSQYAMSLKSIAGKLTNVESGTTDGDFRAYKWPVHQTLKKASNFIIQAADMNNSGTNTVRLAFHGAKMRPGNPPYKKGSRREVPYSMNLKRPDSSTMEGVISLAQGATTTVNLNLDNDAAFMVHKITGTRTGAALISIRDGATDAAWSNNPVHIDNIVGNGAYPNCLPAPRYIPRGSNITIGIQNLYAGTNLIELNLHGVKIF